MRTSRICMRPVDGHRSRCSAFPPRTNLAIAQTAGNRWIKIRLEGVKSNRSAIGARVAAHYGGKVQTQEVLSQSSYLSASDPRLHFGLGAATTADVEIHWPRGLVEKYSALAAGQLVTIREGTGIVKGRPFHKS